MAYKRKQAYSHGRWNVERERCNLDSDAKPPSPDYIIHIQQAVPSVMKSMGLEDRYWEQTLVHEWNALVGEQVAQQTRPGRIHRKVLFVFVRHSSWLNELSRYGQVQMLENIQAKFGAEKIKSIRLQLDPEAR